MILKTRDLVFSGFVCLAIWAGLTVISCETDVRRDTTPLPEKVETVSEVKKTIEVVKDLTQKSDSLKDCPQCVVARADSLFTQLELTSNRLTRKQLREAIKKELLLNYPKMVTK